MLKVTNKNFEIEELVQLTKETDNKEEIVYEFKMQITGDELKEIKNILFDFTKNNFKGYIKASSEEKEELEKKAEEKIKENDERFVDICFKEHKEKFKELAGNYKFEEMIENMRGYFLNFFMKKQISPLNTSISNLTKIMNNFQQFK